MTIKYNNITQPSNIITFSDIPNILYIEDATGGTNAMFTLEINSFFISNQPSKDGMWYITFLNETITNVIDPKNAINKNFCIASTVESTMASMVRAFRNCPNLNATFTIDLTQNGIVFTARKAGEVWANINNDFITNVPPGYYLSTYTNGYSDSPLAGSLINVDVYSDENYITTLEKNCYDGECSFNMTPLLATLSKVGETVPYTFKISTTKNGVYNVLGNVGVNYASVGYMCNQGAKYLDNAYMNVAQNYGRGTSRELSNNTLLYTYFPNIPISVYKGNSAGMTITIEYLDSAYQVITTQTQSWSAAWQPSLLYDINIDLSAGAYSFFNQAFYIDISLGNSAKIRYNVIKPLSATEYGQRILFRNSYGGISFFDFTGKKTETRQLDVSTYQKNVFDYYTDPMNELEKIYDNEVKYSVTLRSHLMENDGKYLFNDMLQSPYVWTEINGENYAIIIDSISVDESDTQNDIFEATITYHYSAEPSLL